MKKLFTILFAFLLCCSMAGAQTLTVPVLDYQGGYINDTCVIASFASSAGWGTETELIDFTESVDRLGEFGVATFTAKYAGNYEFTVTLTPTANFTGLFLGAIAYKNGAIFDSVYQSVAVYMSSICVFNIPLAAGDSVSFRETSDDVSFSLKAKLTVIRH